MADVAVDAIATEMFKAASNTFDSKVQNDQLMCRIYDAYAGPDDAHHNCLGCNLDAITDQISKFLRAAATGATGFNAAEAFSLYALLINTLWERITDVFDIVSVPDGYRKRHYEPMYQMRRWANFFKHPKEFGWLVHHPQYQFEGTLKAAEVLVMDSGFRVIQEEFLKKYYSADRVKGLAKEFNGFERKVVVLLPDIAAVTDKVCGSLANFVEVVTKNPVYNELLNDKATIVNYFDSLTETTTTLRAEPGADPDLAGT
jgi:hypothetical protein